MTSEDTFLEEEATKFVIKHDGVSILLHVPWCIYEKHEDGARYAYLDKSTEKVLICRLEVMTITAFRSAFKEKILGKYAYDKNVKLEDIIYMKMRLDATEDTLRCMMDILTKMAK